VSVAKEWDVDPVEFWELPRVTRMFMIAHSEVAGTMQSFEMKLADK